MTPETLILSNSVTPETVPAIPAIGPVNVVTPAIINPLETVGAPFANLLVMKLVLIQDILF